MFSKWISTASSAGLSSDEKDGSSAENLLLSSSLEENRDAEEWTRASPPSRRSHWLWTILNILLFLFSLSVLLHQAYQKHAEARVKNGLLKKTSFFSPILDRVEIPTYVKQTDGSLFESEHPSPYRNGRKPDPKVNDAWEAFDNIRTFPISADDVRRLGKDPSLAVKFPEEYGLGPDAYVAQLDIFHQIHCLNLLRHLAWAEYDRDEQHGKKPYSELHWVHVSHCTDMLMQNIMCAGNTDVLTFNWMETQKWPFPDFFVNHQCRDFDTIVRWQEENALPLMMGRNLTRPPDAKEIPAPDAYYELFGKEKNVSIHHMI